jgi:hypothetical protein
MKENKLVALCLSVLVLLCCLFGCSDSVKEYDQTPLTTLTYTSVDYHGGFTDEYLFDFEKNIVTKHSFLPTDDEYDKVKTLAEFSQEQEKNLLDRLYTYGFFDIEKEYPAPPGIIDGGGWHLKIHYNDGTSKEACGSNNAPEAVFSECAKAFFDLCGDGVVAYVPSAYYTPPNVFYAINSTVGNHLISQGAPSLGQRGSYRWNGFGETSADYFQLNRDASFPYELDENIAYDLMLYTANYGNYSRFQKCTVISYDFNAELTGEEVVIEKGWFKQIEFDLQFNKIYVVKLSFKNGDFVEYTFNTKTN